MLQQRTEGLRELGQIVERIQDPRELVLCAGSVQKSKRLGPEGRFHAGSGERRQGSEDFMGEGGAKAGSWRVLILSTGSKHYTAGGGREQALG